MLEPIKQLGRAFFRFAGYNVHRIRPRPQPVNRLVEQIVQRGIDTVFDVGANTGQFARELRAHGYAGRIVSFEPVKATFEKLASSASGDPQWEVINCALGAEEGVATINVSRNTWSSSIRSLEKGIVEIEPAVEYISQEVVSVQTLNDVFAKYAKQGDRVFLKLDVQGFENEVLRGASECLRHFEGALSEASLSSVYEGEWLLETMLEHLRNNGFTLFDLVEAFRDLKSGQLIQVDALFWRNANAHREQDGSHAVTPNSDFPVADGTSSWPWTGATPAPAATMPDGAPWPKISIVTPSYNQGIYIEETIRSILLQGYPNLEYFIMDGGSTDDSASIIKKYEPWLTHWVSEKDRGQTHAINKGFALSTGSICCYVNSDDILYPGTLLKVAQAFRKHRSPALVCCSGQLFGPAADRLLGAASQTGRVEHAWTPPASPRLTDWLTTHLSLLQQSVFWDRQVHTALGGFSEELNFCFDKEFFLRAIFELGAYHAHPEILAGGHRLHDATKTATIPAVMISENEDIWRRYGALVWCKQLMAREARERRAQELMASALIDRGFAGRVRSLATSAVLWPGVLRQRMFWGAVRRTLTLQQQAGA